MPAQRRRDGQPCHWQRRIGTHRHRRDQVGTDTLHNIEGVIGSAFADLLTGDGNFFNTFRGGGGNDTINGGFGLDNAKYSDATGTE